MLKTLEFQRSEENENRGNVSRKTKIGELKGKDEKLQAEQKEIREKEN